MTKVVEGLAVQPSSTFTMARIERDREAALRKYKHDRDTTALERTMTRLDDEEREAQSATQVISAPEAVAWLRDLPALWAAADDSGRRLLTEALFEKVEVLGVKSVIDPPDTRGRFPRLERGVRLHAAAHPGGDGCVRKRYGWSGREGSRQLGPASVPAAIQARERDGAFEDVAGRRAVRVVTERQRPTRRELEVLRAYIRAGSVAAAAYPVEAAVSRPPGPPRTRHRPRQPWSVFSSPNMAPCGSFTIAKRPPGMGDGATVSVAPNSMAFVNAASTSGTLKYTIQ